MAERTSALYVSDELAGSRGDLGWRRIVPARIEQIAGCDAHLTMVRLGAHVLYLIEGEPAAVAAFLKLISNDCDDPDARTLVGPTLARWDARLGRLMAPVLSDDERRWLSSRLNSLARNAREIQACLRWANMRTRETALLDSGWAQISASDSFPSAVFQDLDNGPVGAPTSLDFGPE